MTARIAAIRGVAWTAATHATVIGTTFFVTPILFRGLGAERYGLWSIVVALTGYYGLVNMGIGKANTKYIAEFDALGDEQAVCRVVSTGMAMFAVLSVVVLAIGALAALLFPMIIDVGDQLANQIRWVVMLSAAKVAVELLGQVFGAGLAARKRFDLRNLSVIMQLILNAVLASVVIAYGGGLFELAATILALGTLHALVTAFFALRVGLPLPRPSSISRQTSRMLFGFGMLSLVVQVVRRFSLFGGSLLLGVFVGPVSVAFYSVAESLTRRSVALGRPVSTVILPFASQFDAQADRRALRRLLVLPTRVLMTGGLLVTAVLLVMGKSFLALWISPQVATAAFPVVAILSISVFVKMPSNGIQSMLEGMGEMRFLSRVAIGEGAAMMMLAVVLTPLFGAIGMAWAVVVAQCLLSGLCLPFYVCRKLELSTFHYLVQSAVPAAITVLPAVILAVYFVEAVPADSLLWLLLQIGVVTAVAVMLALVICIDAVTRRQIFASLVPFGVGATNRLAVKAEPRQER